MSLRKQKDQIFESLRLTQSGYSTCSRIVVPDFSQAVLQECGKEVVRKTVSPGIVPCVDLKLKAFVYPSGCSLENGGHVSILFTSTTRGLGWVHTVYFPNALTCIVSLIDCSGSERFTQSVVKECENIEEPPFGFERFVKCSTLLNNPEEFIPNDELTICCYVACEEKNENRVPKVMKIPNLPVNLEECPSKIKCCRSDMKECCQSIIKGTDGSYSKLVFKGPLFEFLKKESKFFERIQNYASSMIIDTGKNRFFNHLEEAILFTGEIAVYLSTMSDLYDFYENADHYEILHIMNTCSNFLKDNFTVFNVVHVLFLADLHCDVPLKTAAVHYLKSHLSEVQSAENWKELTAYKKNLVAQIFQDSGT